MVLRSGIIIPFQFRDNKKLLTIGVPEEERDLNIWDLKNVVRSAFGIYNFEFRNKKIGFNIPDDLLLNYLAQRHDLTNFVIEVVQAMDDATQEDNRERVKDVLSYETDASCPQTPNVLPLPPKTNDNPNGALAQNPISSQQRSLQEYVSKNHQLKHFNTNHERTSPKLRITQVFGGHRTPETLTQSIDPMDIIPKSEEENDRCESRASSTPLQYYSNYSRQQHYSPKTCPLFRTYELSTSSCISCRSLPLQKSSDDSSATPAKPHISQRRFRHSSSSNNDSPIAEPAYKVRRQIQNSTELPSSFAEPAPSETEIATKTEFGHLQMEHKVDYDCVSNEDEAVAPVPAVAVFRNDAPPSPEVTFERMQIHHDYYMQQQQQHQQQQLQHHMEMLMQERTGSGITLRQRKERMSRKQKEVYVNFLEQTPVMSEYKRNDPFLDVYWQKLTDILNSVPQGAIKTVNEWKQAFDNWRFRIYLYARYNSKITGDDVMNSKNFKPLTMTDKRAYALWIRNADTAPPDLDKMRNIFVNIDEAPPE